MDRGDLRYEGSHEAGYGRAREREPEEAHQHPAQTLVSDQARPIVGDDDGDRGRQDRRQPGDVLFHSIPRLCQSAVPGLQG